MTATRKFMRTARLGALGLTVGYSDREFVRFVQQSVPGMAHFSGSGNGQCCKDCGHFGFYETIRNKAGDAIGSRFHRNRCRKFYQLTGEVGDTIPPETENCRHHIPRAQASPPTGNRR